MTGAHAEGSACDARWENKMNNLAPFLAGLAVGRPQLAGNLAMFPLVAAAAAAPDYLTLDEALELGAARISEVSEAGSVPELSFVNTSARKVLLVDGEELVGARQNRILNLTILVGAGKTLVIPVSCVEHGRWSYRGRQFGSARRSLFAKARAAKMRDVSMHMRAHGHRASDQQRVWADIEHKRQAMAVESPTGAMADIFEAREGDLARFAAAFTAATGQIGAAFAINGTVRGADVFDSEITFRKFLAKLVGSYALDAVEEGDAGGARPATIAHVKAFLAQLANANEMRYEALGEGADVRLESPSAAAGALEVDGRLVHLAAFAVEA
jgi:hypothetical protein